jgi:hypothetical protein
MSNLKYAQDGGTLSKSEQKLGPLQLRAQRFVDAHMPPGRYELSRIDWKDVPDKLDHLKKLAGQTDHAAVLISNTKDAFLAVGLPPAMGNVGFEAFFDTFFNAPINNRNLLGARSVRLGLPDGNAVFLLPIGGIGGSFEDVFRPVRVGDPGASLSDLLTDLSVSARSADASAARADTACRDAIAAAEMADHASQQTKISAAEAAAISKAIDDASQRANAARDGLEEILDRVQQTTTRLRAVVFGEVAR